MTVQDEEHTTTSPCNILLIIILFPGRLGVKQVPIAVVVTMMVTMAASQLNIQQGLNAGTDESDRVLDDVLSDAKIGGFVNCMIKPWDTPCDDRAVLMSSECRVLSPFKCMND